LSTILHAKNGPIVRLTINRPEAMNALDLPGWRELRRRLEELDADPEAQVAIITGAGDKAFCAGADLKKMYGRGHEGGIRDLWDHERQDRIGQRLFVAKPVIAAINGYCLAGGLELALGCDIRIASTAASFGCPEVRWAILHGFGAIRLPRVVPLAVAMEMLLTGERIDARRAYEVGLVSRIVEPAALMPAAEEIAERICQNGPLAVRITKEIAWRALHQHPEDALRLYKSLATLITQTEDATEGPTAFAEKRAPRFKGR
jgi:enoyl-CoA hydratase/carnithine racemase